MNIKFKKFILITILVIAFFLRDVALEAIHHGYSFGLDYNYEQGMHDVHVNLDPGDEQPGRLYELPTFPTDNAIK